jgi:site-specific DNA-methyltransferase (adenine-specific)
VAEATFLHGDCLEVLPTLPKGSVDMVFCDLPYGQTRNGWDLPVELSSFFDKLQPLCREFSAKCFSATLKFACSLMAVQSRHFRHDLVWYKSNRATGFLNASRAPLRAHELILIFGDKGMTYRPQKTAATTSYSQKRFSQGNWASTTYGRCTRSDTVDTGSRFPVSVLRIDAEYKTVHPTQKPVELLRYLIRTYSNPGDTILDPTAGSGTTAVAALLEGRNSISIEKDPVIFANAKERVLAVQRSLRRPTDA